MPTELPTWREADRPRGPRLTGLTAPMRARGRHLAQIHDLYRSHLAQVRAVLERVAAGALQVREAREAVHAMGLRATYEQLGSFCGQACHLVEVHHTIEDTSMYPMLRRANLDLAPVLERLGDEHVVVHRVLVALDHELVAMVDDPARLTEVRALFGHLESLLLSHFAYEEDELCDPLGFYGVLV
ncbi:MAG: hemerythrin domain-containing protein [Propionibacteriaceae bacterium]